MQTRLAERFRSTPAGRQAEAILRACVHCGFCTATCPTYRLLGDELDGPRGRIYLIKQALEGEPVTAKTQLHLDRCLTCRACETACPSGVEYGRLLDIGRDIVDAEVVRPAGARWLRAALRTGLTGALFGPAYRLGRRVRAFLPATLRQKLVPLRAAGGWPRGTHARRVVLPEGCVQRAMQPRISAAAARVLDRLGFEVVRRAGQAGCCGAIRRHLGDPAGALDDARRSIDAWWPAIEAGAEAIVVTASGCGVEVKDYGRLLATDRGYAAKAARVSALARDVGEFLLPLAPRLATMLGEVRSQRLVFQSPCTLVHGQKLAGVVERLLAALGAELQGHDEAQACCGSAGTYSVTEPKLATRLRDEKLRHLTARRPQLILSANIGCICHLAAAAAAAVPVRHWIEWLDDSLA